MNTLKQNTLGEKKIKIMKLNNFSNNGDKNMQGDKKKKEKKRKK